ncbi:enoyl-CoA hydratase/isomerase family protein [Bogoriella caseilytica]|uniref:enoyl-CoA hydratase n=1 Tax=Bogoriella caseilytica TaxID=56055 RepID=A0A3N2BD51_9MICO|nr:enoyl-CoA hydratase/isomerase family protein [Bogoriella caseilytica]ROR73162.1 short chain enoyl-CoA hydratase [Bogoriella caseilytica]
MTEEPLPSDADAADGASELLLTTIDGPVGWLTLQREGKLNALSRELLLALEAALTDLESDPAVRVVVLTGAGTRAFSAGADLKEVKGTEPAAFLAANLIGHRVFDRVRHSPLPVIAAINGLAAGGGLELALACDLRLAVTDARLGLPEVTVGVVPGWGGTWRLAEAVGAARARELILTGELIEADAAARLGLVSDVLPDGEALRRRAQGLGERMAGHSAEALARAKVLLGAGENPAALHATAESGSVAALLGTTSFAHATRRF